MLLHAIQSCTAALAFTLCLYVVSFANGSMVEDKLTSENIIKKFISNLRQYILFVGAKFYCPHALADNS